MQALSILNLKPHLCHRSLASLATDPSMVPSVAPFSPPTPSSQPHLTQPSAPALSPHSHKNEPPRARNGVPPYYTATPSGKEEEEGEQLEEEEEATESAGEHLASDSLSLRDSNEEMSEAATVYGPADLEGACARANPAKT